MTGAFDAEAFMAQQTKSANATKIDPIPEGEYQAVITENVTVRQGESAKSGETFIVMDVEWELQSGPEDLEALKKRLNRRKLTVRQSLFLDVENGMIAEGENKNARLGKLRAAIGQNNNGKPWSPLHLKNAGPATIIVRTRPDENDPDIVYNDVRRVAPPSRGGAPAAA